MIRSLAISGDPLSWARNSAASAAAPSAVLRDADDTGSDATFSRVAAWRAGRERVALDEHILQTLSVATRDAVDILQRVTPPEKPLPVDEHFTAAAAFAAFAYDGSQASTMTVAMLTPASSKSWDALPRARARAGRHARRRVLRGGDGLVARGRAFRRVSCSVRGGDHGSRRRRGGFHLLHSDGRDDDVVGHLADDASSGTAYSVLSGHAPRCRSGWRPPRARARAPPRPRPSGSGRSVARRTSGFGSSARARRRWRRISRDIS